MQNKMISYLESQRRDSTWSALFTPFLNEVFTSLGEDQTRHMLIKAGMRAAQDLPLPACESIGQLEQAANAHLSRFGWGIVTFTEHQDFLEITHESIPKDAPALNSFADFLIGLYQQWFRNAGAGDSLQVRQTNEEQIGTFSFRLVG